MNALPSPPYITKMEQNRDGVWEMDGLFPEIFFTLQVCDRISIVFHSLKAGFLKEIMNFSYVARPSSDGNWGSLEADGSWNGIIGHLERAKIKQNCAFSL